MIASLLVVFREVLEAALIVGIVLAATRGIRHRIKWIALGVAGGVTCAGFLAALTETIAGSFQGVGQEIVNAGILFGAVALITWHVVWMHQHGREMATQLRAHAKQVTDGEKHMSMLAMIVGLAVMREGAEVVLILQGMMTGTDAASMLTGAVLGLGAGVVVGSLMYFGLLALPVGRMFTFTNGLLILIAAGMAAQGAHFLAQAGLLPSLGERLWDSSFILSDEGVIGKMVSVLFGYTARPSGIQLLAYGLTVGSILLLTRRTARKSAPVVAAAALVALTALAPHPVSAASVYSPYVEEGEVEIEHKGMANLDDDNPSQRDGHELVAGLSYSPTDFYRTEVELEWERENGSGERLRYHALEWANVLALTERGEYWLDPAAYLELEFGRDDTPNKAVFGVIAAKQVGRTLHTVNLFGAQEFAGQKAGPASFIYREQSKFVWRPWLQPGFEIYGDTKGKDKFHDQKLAIGPGLFGKIPTFEGQGIKYEATYLFGATRANTSQAVRWKLEYEFHF